MITTWGKLAQKTRVPVGTVIGLAFLCFNLHPSVRSLWIGGTIALAGGLIRLWAAGHIEKGRSLAQGGPYARTRNPLYLGSFLMALGVLLAGQGYWLLLPFGCFFLAFYYPVMKTEEQELLQGHGETFRSYAQKVPLFIPTISAGGGSSSTFLWSRVVRNREHRTLATLLFTVALLIVWRIVHY